MKKNSKIENAIFKTGQVQFELSVVGEKNKLKITATDYQKVLVLTERGHQLNNLEATRLLKFLSELIIFCEQSKNVALDYANLQKTKIKDAFLTITKTERIRIFENLETEVIQAFSLEEILLGDFEEFKNQIYRI